jgi:hypothetical protein
MITHFNIVLINALISPSLSPLLLPIMAAPKKNTAKSRQPLGERSANLPSAATNGQKKEKTQESGNAIAAFVSCLLLPLHDWHV